MNCLVIALGVYHTPGGIQAFNQRLLRALAELGQAEELRCSAISLWDRREDAGHAPRSIRFYPCASNKAAAVLRFCRSVWSEAPDVIVYGHILLAPLAFAARVLRPRTRNILVVHGWEVWREPFRRRVPIWEKVALRWGIDEVISVSRHTMERMTRAYRLPEGRRHTLPNAVDWLAEPAPGSRPPRQGRVLLSVSRLTAGTWHKGCAKVIEALPRVIERLPEVEYHIVGEGELRPRLEALARELGVAERVVFHGRLDEASLEAMYRRADVFALPSKKEGFGIVYLEAWKHGLPVIAGNQDAGAEVVTHGYNGLCVNPDSPEEIAGALLELLTNRERAERMGQAGRRTVEEKYTHEHFRSRLRGILRQTAEQCERVRD
jgi:glycosyltransferase involved in cell wall biosynthesis